MTLKKERLRHAREIRRVTGVGLPTSVRLAKRSMGHRTVNLFDDLVGLGAEQIRVVRNVARCTCGELPLPDIEFRLRAKTFWLLGGCGGYQIATT